MRAFTIQSVEQLHWTILQTVFPFLQWISRVLWLRLWSLLERRIIGSSDIDYLLGARFPSRTPMAQIVAPQLCLWLWFSTLPYIGLRLEI